MAVLGGSGGMLPQKIFETIATYPMTESGGLAATKHLYSLFSFQFWRGDPTLTRRDREVTARILL